MFPGRCESRCEKAGDRPLGRFFIISFKGLILCADAELFELLSDGSVKFILRSFMYEVRKSGRVSNVSALSECVPKPQNSSPSNIIQVTATNSVN